MKKLLSLFLALALLASCSSSFAAGYDLTYVEENDSVFTIDVDSDRGVAFIESTLSASDRSFTHKYESDYRYSSTMFDILVINYGESDAYPVPRLWITYCADKYLYYDSVTFTVEGMDYTFTDIDDSEWRSKDEKGVIEQVLIKFGTENLKFLAALEDLYEKYPTYNELMDEIDGPKIRMVLHGRNEDLKVTLRSGFMLDYALIIQGAYINTDGLDYIGEVNSSHMTVD